MTKQDKVAKVMHEWKAGTLTSNGKQVTDYDQAVAIALSEAGLSKYEGGGSIEKENALMVANNNKQIAHHTEEMEQALKDTDYVPAWVVAKVNRSASDLSDATHYLEGQEEEDKYDEGGGIEEEVPLRADIDGDIYEVIGVNHKLNKVRAKNFSSGDVIEMPINKWYEESFEFGTQAKFKANGREYVGMVTMKDGQKSISLYNDENYSGDAERVIPFYKIDLKTLKPTIKKEMFAKGGDIEDADDFIKNVKEMHESIDYVVLKDGTKVNGYDIMREGGEMNEYARGGSFTKKEYDIPYDLKITGIYTFKTSDGKEYKFAITGFERENDDEFAFLFSGWNREENDGLRAVIVKNSSIRKMSKGETVMARNSKGEKGKLTRVADSFMGMPIKGEMNKFAVGGEIGNTVTFSRYGERTTGRVTDKLKNGYEVVTDEGTILVEPQEVISFSETPIAKKKRFGFFEGGGSVESLLEQRKELLEELINSDIIDEEHGYYDDVRNAIKSNDSEQMREIIDELLSSGLIYKDDWDYRLARKLSKEGRKFEGGGDVKNEPKLGDLITNYGKYGSSIIEIDEKFVYWLDNYASKNHCEKSDLVLNNLDDDGDDDGYYEDERNNWICKRKYAGGGEIENKIEKLKKVVSSKMLPESVKAKAQAEIDKLEKELHESKETKAEEKAEHEVGGKEAKEDLIEIAKKMATERGLRPTNIVDELDAIRTISSIMANESGFSYSKVDDLGNNEYIIEIVTFNEEKKKKQAGMVLNKYKDGTYEVAEMQAGKDGNFIKVFGEYKNLKPAVAKLLKGNKQKPMKVIDMRSPSEIAKENKMTGESEGERKAGMDEEKDYIEAKTKALEKSLKDKTISETQRKRDEKELALFKGAEAKKPTTTSKKEVVGYAIVDPISGEIVVSKKTIRQLIEASKKLEKTKGFEDMGDLAYEIIKKDDKNVLGDKIESVDIRLLPINKKPTTRKAPIKKAVVKKAEVKKEVETKELFFIENSDSNYKTLKKQFPIVNISKDLGLYMIGGSDDFNYVKKRAKQLFNLNLELIDVRNNPNGNGNVVLFKIIKPKADHKKLVAKLKAKKGDKEYDNRASINVKTGERYKRSESSDKKREALQLGKRVSESGKIYYENRLNRGDLSKKDKFEDGGEVKGSDWGLNLNW